ncbi:alpha/beta hydrolase [Loktanella sp. S4079]|uniref:alpha/beta hydrolase n=1 Tax=Loktanella sp. S4079 TaxID=579483 RepID=UPI000A9F36F9|nr:alpha/beta hydrolase [Loktanella sp. S4079]
MVHISLEDAAKLAEASYSSKRITSPRVMHSCPHKDVQAHLLEGNILLLPGSNSVSDYLRYNLRPLLLGHKRLTLKDNSVAPGKSGTLWHQGFLAYASVVADWLIKLRVTPSYIIGHSLGAAATQILAKSYGVPGVGFAAPRPLFTRGPITSNKQCLLINRRDDPVPNMPKTFQHVGKVTALKPTVMQHFRAHKMSQYRAIVEAGQSAGVLPSHWAGR